MSYSYQAERPRLFTEGGQVALMKARDNAALLLAKAGAFMSFKALEGVGFADTFQAMAILDRLVELGYIREVTANVWGQHRVFVAGSKEGE